MAQDGRTIDDQALDWIVRTGDPGFDDWPGFMAWMEADPAHAARYQALSADIDEGVAMLPPAAPVAMTAPAAIPSRRRYRWAGGAIAASLAVVAGYAVLDQRAEPYAVETAQGATRTIALADGSRMTLGGGSRVMLDRSDSRVATLDRGAAMFVVRHDPADPFEVRVGEARLVDVGTAFDVTRTADGLRVAVSEGAVDYNPGADAIRLTPGQGLAVSGVRAVRYSVETSDVGAWREGRLAFDGVALSEVASDLSRTLGIAIAVAPAIADRPVRATIMTAGLRDDPTALAALLNVTMRRSATGWTMSAR